jgi:hypothetical protein
MTTLAPRARVAAPPRTRTNAGSLLTSATIIRDGVRFAGGIAYEPEFGYIGGSIDPCAGGTKTITAPHYIVEWDPYAIWVGDSCATLGGEATYSDLVRRVSTALDAQESHLIEQILWTNMVDGVDFGATHPNVSLADSAASTPAGTTGIGIVDGIREIVQYFNGALGGGRGMIHVPQSLVPFLDFYGLITRNGNLLQLANTDHLIVAGSGYNGSDPDGVTYASWVWIYGTSPVEVYLTDKVILPDNASDATVRVTNQFEVRAEALALAHWDLMCHVGVPVCIPDPGPDCSPSGS